MKDLISKKTRYELSSYLGGFYLRAIDHECEAVDMTPDETHHPTNLGQRMTRARQYMHALDFTKDADARKFLALAENLLNSCKTILMDRGKPARGTEDVMELVKAARAELRLVPTDVPNAAKGAETVKRVLSNLAAVAQGLAELRSLYGTGHGREAKSKGVKPRHARLAVHAASALAVFLFETHRDLAP